MERALGLFMSFEIWRVLCPTPRSGVGILAVLRPFRPGLGLLFLGSGCCSRYVRSGRASLFSSVFPYAFRGFGCFQRVQEEQRLKAQAVAAQTEGSFAEDFKAHASRATLADQPPALFKVLLTAADNEQPLPLDPAALPAYADIVHVWLTARAAQAPAPPPGSPLGRVHEVLLAPLFRDGQPRPVALAQVLVSTEHLYAYISDPAIAPLIVPIPPGHCLRLYVDGTLPVQASFFCTDLSAADTAKAILFYLRGLPCRRAFGCVPRFPRSSEHRLYLQPLDGDTQLPPGVEIPIDYLKKLARGELVVDADKLRKEFIQFHYPAGYVARFAQPPSEAGTDLTELSLDDVASPSTSLGIAAAAAAAAAALVASRRGATRSKPSRPTIAAGAISKPTSSRKPSRRAFPPRSTP